MTRARHFRLCNKAIGRSVRAKLDGRPTDAIIWELRAMTHFCAATAFLVLA